MEDFYGKEPVAQTSDGMGIAYGGEEGTREPSDEQGGMFLLSCSFPERNHPPTSL